MATTFGEIKRRVHLGMPGNDGETLLVIEEAVNIAHHVIAAVMDFDDLIVLDTTNAVTVASQKLYHIENDFNLVRPKDIYSIRYMDESNSRKLIYVPVRELDTVVPYTEQVGEGKPSWYTRRGKYIELYRIPNEAKPLYIQHSQWPARLTDDTDETPFTNIDHVIVGLAINITHEIIQGVVGDWEAIATKMLRLSMGEENTRPDEVLVAKPFSTVDPQPFGDDHLNPWVKRNT
jgi:hypothetical protein